MSVMTGRGGVPHVWRATVTVGGVVHQLHARCFYLQLKTVTNPVKLYFTQEDFDNDEHYIAVAIASATEPHGFAGPVTADRVWLKGNGGSAAVELVSYDRQS